MAKKEYSIEKHIGDDVISDIANWIKSMNWYKTKTPDSSQGFLYTINQPFFDKTRILFSNPHIYTLPTYALFFFKDTSSDIDLYFSSSPRRLSSSL